MSFLTPLLTKFTADIEAAVAAAKTNILREFEGIAAQTRAPGVKAPQPWEPRQQSSRRANGGLAKGRKRTPEALALKVEEVFTLIQRHPGERIEQLAHRGGLSTKEMALPIKKLRDAKRITASGQKRATTYTARATR